MNKKIHLSICISLSLILNWSCAKSSNTSQPPNNSSVKLTPTSANTPQTEVSPLVNFFPLANKSVAEIEKVYGKPLMIDKKIVQSKDAEFRHYRIFKGIENKLEDIQVDYYKGKAVGFYLNIPKKFQSRDLQEIIKICGFKLDPIDAQTGEIKIEFWWDNIYDAYPFNDIYIRRYRDSELFYLCEAHVDIK